jgi:hypoxanthine-DNA glycosylase
VPIIRSFPPIVRPDATRLILGSIPGRRSLEMGQYYAHRQNAFWRIFAALLGFDAAAPYDARCLALQQAGFALWDVLKACERPSSLDSDIVESSIEPNDFAALLQAHEGIGAIFFIGAKAEAAFGRYVLPELTAGLRAIPRLRLPSTSPAHAGLRFEAKLAAWRRVLEQD